MALSPEDASTGSSAGAASPAAGPNTVRSRARGEAPRAGGIAAGWGWLGLLRLGLGLAMGIYAAVTGTPTEPNAPSYLVPAALGLAAIPTLLGVVQLTRRMRASRAMALAAVPLDTAAVFATLALYAFEPDRYLLALVVVIQAEAAAVLGIRGGLAAWAVTSAGYVAVEALAESVSGEDTRWIEVTLRIGVGLILVMGGGFLAEELSGERRRRLAERERQLRRLEEAEERYRSLVEQIPAVPYVGAAGDRSAPTYLSPQIEALTGFAPEAWTSDPGFWRGRIHPKDRDRILAEQERVGRGGEPFRQEYRLTARDGRVIWVRDESVVVPDDAGRPLFRQGVLMDITERKQAEEQVAFLAYHDNLTRLPNRLTFEQLLEVALARARRSGDEVAVLYMDVDNFKDVNDGLGHPAGDQLLREVAGRLREAVRESDVVARQGGDEFLVLLADLPTAGTDGHGDPAEVASAVAARLHEALEAPFDIGGQLVNATVSIGISLFPTTAGGASELLKQADVAMYRSKRSAPGRSVVFGP